jgi:hypothetical protein
MISRKGAKTQRNSSAFPASIFFLRLIHPAQTPHQTLALQRPLPIFFLVIVRIKFALVIDLHNALAVAARNRYPEQAMPAKAVADVIERFDVRRMRERQRAAWTEKVKTALVHAPPEHRLFLIHLSNVLGEVVALEKVTIGMRFCYLDTVFVFDNQEQRYMRSSRLNLKVE